MSNFIKISNYFIELRSAPDVLGQRSVIEKELTKLSIHYRAAKVSEEEIETVLAKTWAEDLEDLTDTEFLEALREVRRSSHYFPTSAEIREKADERRARAGREASSQEALPQTPTQISEVERKRNQRRAQEILKYVRGNRTTQPTLDEEDL